MGPFFQWISARMVVPLTNSDKIRHANPRREGVLLGVRHARHHLKGARPQRSQILGLLRTPIHTHTHSATTQHVSASSTPQSPGGLTKFSAVNHVGTVVVVVVAAAAAANFLYSSESKQHCSYRLLFSIFNVSVG